MKNYKFEFQGIKISNEFMCEMLVSKVDPVEYYGEVYLDYLNNKKK